MNANSPKLLRWSALALFVIGPMALAVGTLMFVLDIVEKKAAIAAQQELIAQLDARMNRLSGGEKTLGDTTPIYITAESPALASAALQQRLVSAAEAAKGRVIETQTVEETTPSDGATIRLKITLDVNNGGLLSLLHDLETGLPLIAVDSIAIRQLPSAADELSEDPILRVDLGVRAVRRTPA